MSDRERAEALEERAHRARERVCRLEARLDSWESACRSDPALEPLRQEVLEAHNELQQIEHQLAEMRGCDKPSAGVKPVHRSPLGH